MNVPEHLKDLKSKSFNKSRYFSAFGKFVLDERFVGGDFWERLFEFHVSKHRELLSSFKDIAFDHDMCHTSPSSTNGKRGTRTTTRKNCKLPETGKHPAKTYRISPRIVYFYLEFGCIRQVKTACGNRECINPYHQMPESQYERSETGSMGITSTFGQTVPFANFVVGMSLSEAINIVNNAGHTETEISKMPLQDFIKVAMSHYGYITANSLTIPTEEAIIIAGRN